MDVLCPDCLEKFDLDKNEFDEGDSVECPDCGNSLKIKVIKGKFRLSTPKEAIHDFDEVDFDDD